MDCLHRPGPRALASLSSSVSDFSLPASLEMRPSAPTCNVFAVDPAHALQQQPGSGSEFHVVRRPTLSAVIVDPQRAFAELLSGRIQQAELVRSAEVCVCAAEAIAALVHQPPCLVLSAYHLGTTMVHTLIEALPAEFLSRTVVMGDRIGNQPLERLVRWGVGGCVLKSDPLDELLNVITAVISGKRALSAALQLQFEDLPRDVSGEILPGPLSEFGPRQMQALVMLAQGSSVKEVAQGLQISAKTVDSMKYRLMKTLGFHDRVELTRYAIREGLIVA